jgi:hypothetical protein
MKLNEIKFKSSVILQSSKAFVGLKLNRTTLAPILGLTADFSWVYKPEQTHYFIIIILATNK